MIPLEELFARLESSAEEVHGAAGLVPRPQKHKRFRNEASGNRNVPAYMHLCICLELRLFILDFFF